MGSERTRYFRAPPRRHHAGDAGAGRGREQEIELIFTVYYAAVSDDQTKGDVMNGKGEPKLLFPGLAGFYAAVSDLWYPMIRIAIGAILFMHGYAKVANLGIAKVAGAFGNNYGLPMPTLLAYSAVFLETVGAICIVIGLFTR